MDMGDQFLCWLANGKYLPPFIVFKEDGQVDPGTLYAVSNNGWMEVKLFYNWLNTMFVEYIKYGLHKLNLIHVIYFETKKAVSLLTILFIIFTVGTLLFSLYIKTKNCLYI